MHKKRKIFRILYNINKAVGGDFIKIATSSMIKNIDDFAENHLHIPITVLMGRSGEAAASAVRNLLAPGGNIVFLCGCGNNGGDGYAAATKLISEYNVTVFDVFEKGQKSESGRYWRAEYINSGGKIVMGIPTQDYISQSVDLVVDAIFGTGFSGEVPKNLIALSNYINEEEKLKVCAIDIPLGVCADDGSVESFALRSDVTVALSFPKVAMYSYPAKEYVGEVVVDDLGIQHEAIAKKFTFNDWLIDLSLASSIIPKRYDNSNKGSFGKSLLIVGSDRFMGAAALAFEGALRGGAGYVSFLGTDELCTFLLNKFPEGIYNRTLLSDTEKILSMCERQDAVLIGCGVECNENIYKIISNLVETDGAPLIIDADGINSISKFGSSNILKRAKRKIILTPHPLEFSRLTGLSVDYIQANRYRVAKEFAAEYGCVLLLKGAGTVITDGLNTFVNGSGSSALAKAGSGDVLAGLLVSILAYFKSPLESAALAAFIHGRAGDLLSSEFSNYGVIPSDIPQMAAKVFLELEKNNGL